MEPIKIVYEHIELSLTDKCDPEQALGPSMVEAKLAFRTDSDSQAFIKLALEAQDVTNLINWLGAWSYENNR